MCRMIGCFSATSVEMKYSLLEAPHALVRQSLQDRSGKCHGDGWGLACFNNDSSPRIEKSLRPAYHDGLFSELATRWQAPVWIAHVRAASTGKVRLENTHPFQYGKWVWAHNGTIIRPLDVLMETMLATVNPTFRSLRRGTTDSELCFLIFLSELSRRNGAQLDNPSVEVSSGTMLAVVNFLRTIAAPYQQEGPSMNFMASNGKMLLAVRWGKSLWTLHTNQIAAADQIPRSGDHEQRTAMAETIFIASEPFDDSDWKEVPDHSLVIVDRPGALQIVSVKN